VVVLAPAFGLLLDRFLFRRIPEYQYDSQDDYRAHASGRIPALLPVLLVTRISMSGADSVQPYNVYLRLAGYPVNGMT